MNIYELWRARLEDRFGLRHYFHAWVISSRPFAIPWVALFTLFGVLLAGLSSVERAVASCLITTFVLLASHFRNNYKDVELGIDRYVDSPREAESICSTVKPYTAASWIVPLRITGIRFQKVNEMIFTFLAMAVYALFFTVDLGVLIHTLPILVMGILVGRTYSTFFKPYGFGEVAAFMGHGFGSTVFGYLSQSQDFISASLAGVPPGIISALVYSVDQFVDIRTDLVLRVRSIYESWFNSRMPLGLYVLIVVAFWLNVVVAWVAAGLYPRGTLLVLSILPLALFIAPQLEYDRDRALMRIALIGTFITPLLLCIGTLI
ncbi:MAG: hypothetical protein QW088_07380 [Desulfurococcaceae archaeon]